MRSAASGNQITLRSFGSEWEEREQAKKGADPFGEAKVLQVKAAVGPESVFTGGEETRSGNWTDTTTSIGHGRQNAIAGGDLRPTLQ